MSGSIILWVVVWGGAGGQAHSLALEVDAIHERNWRTGRVCKVWIYVWNRNWRWEGSPVLHLFIQRVTFLSIISNISIFLGLPVTWRVSFQKLQKSQAVSQSFLIREYIHLLPVVFTPRNWRCMFLILAQDPAFSPVRAWIHPIFVWFSKSLSTARGGGVDGICPLSHVEMTWRMSEIIWGLLCCVSPF